MTKIVRTTPSLSARQKKKGWFVVQIVHERIIDINEETGEETELEHRRSGARYYGPFTEKQASNVLAQLSIWFRENLSKLINGEPTPLFVYDKDKEVSFKELADKDVIKETIQ